MSNGGDQCQFHEVNFFFSALRGAGPAGAMTKELVI